MCICVRVCYIEKCVEGKNMKWENYIIDLPKFLLLFLSLFVIVVKGVSVIVVVVGLPQTIEGARDDNSGKGGRLWQPGNYQQ